jgi:DNA-binding NarL/FixJ family response regulator
MSRVSAREQHVRACAALISLGMPASSVPRDAVDAAVAAVLAGGEFLRAERSYGS